VAAAVKTLAVLGALAVSSPLSLDEVLEAVPRHPRVEAAAARVAGAAGRQRQAEGAYDVGLVAELGGAPLGKYRRFGGGLGVEQELATVGRPRLYATYRNGADHPLYDGKRVTSSFGQLGAGVRLDLLRDLFIDPDRASLERARLEQVAASAEQEQALLATQAQAADAFWSWVQAGEALLVEQRLSRLAEERQASLEAQVRRGLLAPIVLDDNRRLVQHRSERVARAGLALVAAANDLSLYLRDEAGRPSRPDPERLPQLPAARPPGDITLQAALEGLSEALPWLQALEATRSAVEVEARLARNDALPRAQLDVGAFQDAGDPRPYGTERSFNETEIYTQLSVSWPVQRRAARGREQAARAAARELDEEARLVRDSAEVSVRTAWEALGAALARAAFAAEAVEAAERLEAAERRLFAAGASDLLILNLREQATADEQRAVLEARADVQRAWARFLVAQGRAPRVG
jgi:outer membrane protein TolC